MSTEEGFASFAPAIQLLGDTINIFLHKIQVKPTNPNVYLAKTPKTLQHFRPSTSEGTRPLPGHSSSPSEVRVVPTKDTTKLKLANMSVNNKCDN